jgi:ATP-binding cassette, subfamily B, bacterial RamA/AmfB
LQSAGRILIRTVWENRRWGACLLLASLLGAAVGLALPALLGAAVDAAIGHGPEPATMLVAVIALLVAATGAEVLTEVADARARIGGTAGLRGQVFRHVLRLGLPGTRAFGTGDMVSRAVESTTQTAGVTQAVVYLVVSLTTSVGGTVALFLIDPWLGLVFLAVAPVIWWGLRWLIRRIAAVTEDYQRAQSELSGRFLDAVAGVPTIRASGTVIREIERVLEPLDRLRAAGSRFWDAQRKAMWQLGLTIPLVRAVALAVAGLGVAQGRISPGELLAALGYTGYALGLLRQVNMLSQTARAHGSARRLAEVLDQPVPSTGSRSLPPGAGHLELRGIVVTTESGRVLDGLDLNVPPGGSVALVGASGTGKSIVAEIAGGLRRPDAGEVLLDGVPLDQLDPDIIREAVSYAFERPVLLGSTVADAINYADRPVGRDMVRAALLASAAGFVDRLPDGVDTRLDRLRMSGGELQRLGIARALCRNNRLLLLDDATSSVDTITEAEISASITCTVAATTRMVIAQRVSTARHADTVAWLHDGRIRAIAPHEVLMSDPGYRALFQPAPEVAQCPRV